MAAPDPSLTPEKRLLQLIEGASTDEPEQPVAVKESPFAKIQQLLSPEKIREMLLDLKAKIIAVARGKAFVNLQGVNKIAKGATIALGVYLLLAIIFEATVLNSRYVTDLRVEEVTDIDALEYSEKKIFETDILKDPENITVFLPPAKRVKEEKTEKKNDFSLQMAEMTKEWRLTGISIYPDDPKRTFCMVEDLKKSVTVFLRVGDTLQGLTVEEIHAGGVVFKFGEQKIELR